MSEARCWRDQAACRELVTAQYDPFFADTAELQAAASRGVVEMRASS
jgi:hypothetical protein